MHGQCGGIACAKDPGGGDIETLAELIVEYDGEVVSAVVLGRERVAVVQNLAFAVEEVGGATPCIGNPASKLTKITLCEEFNAIGPPVAHAYEVFPSLGGAEGSHAIFILNEIGHALVVTLKG